MPGESFAGGSLVLNAIDTAIDAINLTLTIESGWDIEKLVKLTEISNKQFELTNKHLEQINSTLSTSVGQVTKTLQEKLPEAGQVEKSKTPDPAPVQEFNSQLIKTETQMMALSRTMNQGMQRELDGLLNSFANVIEGSKSFKVLLNDLLSDVLRGVANRLGGGRNRAGGVLADLTSVILGDLSFRAGGGAVSAGSPFVVGERGPELFVPQTAGQVVANAKLSGQSGGMGAVNITVKNNSGQNVTAQGQRNAAGGVDVEVMIDSMVARAMTRSGSKTTSVMNTVFGLTPGLSRR